MCGVRTAWCRLCLTSDILPPYLDLTEDHTGQVRDLCSLLGLDLTPSSPHLPGQVCAICLSTVQSFTRLRERARNNQRLLQHNQPAIRSPVQGLPLT